MNLKNKRNFYWPLTPGDSLNTSVATLVIKTITKLSLNLDNITKTTLAIDIIVPQQKFNLLKEIIQEFETILIRNIQSKLSAKHIAQHKTKLLKVLIQRSTYRFIQQHFIQKSYSKLYRLKPRNYVQCMQLEDFLEIILSFCLFGSSNKTYIIFNPVFGDQVPIQQVEILFENFIIRLGNYIVDTLLQSSLGITYGFQNYLFHEKFFSLRKIEQFRNNLMWSKAVDKHINIPKAIYESRFIVWTITPNGITSRNIYGHRLYELPQLSTTQLITTFILEIEDFVLPKIFSLTKLISTSLVQILFRTLKFRFSKLERK